MGRSLVRAIAVAMLLTAATVSPSMAGDGAGDGLGATLDGKGIRVERIPTYHCHDFDYPMIRCFSSAEGLAADIAVRGSTDAARLLLSGYVTAWADVGYSGASISLANDYSSLGSVGWNDRISSFKSYGASGGFWEHSPPGGFYYGYAATTQVSSLGGAYNDKFSAFNID